MLHIQLFNSYLERVITQQELIDFSNTQEFKELLKSQKKALFTKLCERGDLELVVTFCHLYPTILSFRLNKPFVVACENGYYDILRYLVDCFPGWIIEEEYYISKSYTVACANGHYDICDYLSELNSFAISFGNQFAEMAKRGKTESMIWLLQKEFPADTIWQISFMNSCIKNHLDTCKFIKDTYKFININNLNLFEIISQHSNIHTIKWIYENFMDNLQLFPNVLNNSLINSVIGGNLEVVKFLYGLLLTEEETDKSPVLKCKQMDNVDSDIFKTGLHYGHLHIIEWINEVGNIKQDDKLNSINKKIHIICEKPHKELLKWCVNHFQIQNIIIQDVKLFYTACMSGDVEVVLLLLQLYPTLIHSYIKEEIFNSVCIAGYVSVAQLLYEKWKNDITTEILMKNMISLLVSSQITMDYEDDYLQMFIWLFSFLDEHTKTEKIGYIFRRSCSGHILKICQYIYENYPDIDITEKRHYAFRKAAYNECDSIALWLCSLKPDVYLFTEEDSGKITYKLNVPMFVVNETPKTYDSINDTDNCCVCYEKSELVTNCTHYYCVYCVNRLYEKINISYEKNNKCAMCRQYISEFYKIEIIDKEIVEHSSY